MPDFEKLRFHVKVMHQLLADTQPGLASWCLALGEHWKVISDLWLGPDRAPDRTDAIRYHNALERIARLARQTNMSHAADAANTAIEIAREALQSSVSNQKGEPS